MAAVNISKEMEAYVSDFGVSYPNFGFKIKDSYEDILDIYQDREFTVCGPGNLFKPRQLEATFLTDLGLDTVLFPIPTAEQVRPAIASLLDVDNVVCLTYLGERWPRVPAPLLPGSSFNPSAQLTATAAGNKTTGSASYLPDTLAEGLVIGVQFEDSPTPVATGIQGCLLEFNVGGFCNETSGVSPRKLVFKARRTGRPGQFVVRSAPVSARGPAALRACSAALSTNFVCVGYEGERYRNLQNVIAPV